MKETISLKEHQKIVNAYESSLSSLRIQWSMDTKKMMRLWDSHQRLIAALERISTACSVESAGPWMIEIQKEIEKGKEVKI